MLTNSCGTFMSRQPSGGQGLLSSGAHIPAKSGLPSAVLGAGASRFGVPLVLRGAPAVGYFSHCANTGVEIAQNSAAPARVMPLERRFLIFIGTLVIAASSFDCDSPPTRHVWSIHMRAAAEAVQCPGDGRRLLIQQAIVTAPDPP